MRSRDVPWRFQEASVTFQGVSAGFRGNHERSRGFQGVNGVLGSFRWSTPSGVPKGDPGMFQGVSRAFHEISGTFQSV